MQKSVIVTSPKPFQEIGAEFNLIGSVPESLLLTSFGVVDMRLFTEYIDIDGKTFMGGTIFVRKLPRLFSFLSKRCIFGQVEKFSWVNVGFIERSQGRITLKISGHEKVEPIYIPLVVKEFDPENGASAAVVEKHRRVGETIEKYKRDLKDYYAALTEINASRKAKDGGKDPQYLYGKNVGIASQILKILNDSEEKFEEYEYSEEDKRERDLEEKYKDALQWRGPLFKGIVSQFGGFELRVYSDDHDKHFHVIHRGRGINARFSFPEMRLINYKNSKSTIGSKEERQIRELCLKPEIFQKFEKEFQKRAQ